MNSFQRKFDDTWVDVVNFGNYANASLVSRAYPADAIDPALNFVPTNNFATRSKPLYDAEATAIDVIMYKITDRIHADAMVRAVKRGVPVRLITEPNRYRNTDNVWEAYNLDRMWLAGVKIRERAHLGLLHQKTTLLYSLGQAIFGSSNWTTASNQTSTEHNYFARDPVFFEAFRKIFARKWASTSETRSFTPLPPDPPQVRRAAQRSRGADDDGNALMETGAMGAPRGRVSRNLVDAGALRQGDRGDAQHDQEAGDLPTWHQGPRTTGGSSRRRWPTKRRAGRSGASARSRARCRR